MRPVGTSLVMLATALAAGTASAITLTGLTPSPLKVKVGQPVQLTLTATGVPAAGPARCFFLLTLGDGTVSLGPEATKTGFNAGSASLTAFSYVKAGTFTATVTPRTTHQGAENPLQIAADDYFAGLGVQPCQGTATATITVWDPYHEPAHRRALHLPPPPEGAGGPSKPGPGPVETTMLCPGTAVTLNPQPLPPGSHTESFQTSRGPMTAGGALAVAGTPAPPVRAAAASPVSVREGDPVRLAVTADPGCTGVLIGWGDGSTQDQSLDPRALERPIQHVYRKVGAETVTVAGEHGCLGQAMAALTVTAPLQLVTPLKVGPAAHR